MKFHEKISIYLISRVFCLDVFKIFWPGRCDLAHHPLYFLFFHIFPIFSQFQNRRPMGISKGFCANQTCDHEFITSKSQSTTQFPIVQLSSNAIKFSRSETSTSTSIHSTFLTPRFPLANSNPGFGQ